MELKDIILKFKDELEDYIYVDNIDNLQLSSRILYISKNNLIIKRGILKDKRDSILVLTGFRKWYIYTDKYYIFVKNNNYKRDKFKEILKALVDNNFEKKKL